MTTEKVCGCKTDGAACSKERLPGAEPKPLSRVCSSHRPQTLRRLPGSFGGCQRRGCEPRTASRDPFRDTCPGTKKNRKTQRNTHPCPPSQGRPLGAGAQHSRSRYPTRESAPRAGSMWSSEIASTETKLGRDKPRLGNMEHGADSPTVTA